MKPITWIPLIWGVICGAAASGNFEWTFSNVLASLACMLMSGPLLAGYTQTINDFFDKEIDAINEPNRPIPSGKISIKDVKIQIWVLLLAGLIVALDHSLYSLTFLNFFWEKPVLLTILKFCGDTNTPAIRHFITCYYCFRIRGYLIN